MTLLNLIVRWLRYRGAVATPVRDGIHIHLSPDDPLQTSLGPQFTLAELAPQASTPPGIEPVYLGSRIADLCAGDLEAVRGIAVVAAPAPSSLVQPIFIFSFRVVFLTATRTERLIRFALIRDGQEVAIPSDGDAPLVAASSGGDWPGPIQELLPRACQIVRQRALDAGRKVEQLSQRSLYLTARRLATFYSQYREQVSDPEAIAAEYQQRLAEEVDRHRLRVTVTLIGVMVVVP